jgi:hypothetical protein
MPDNDNTGVPLPSGLLGAWARLFLSVGLVGVMCFMLYQGQNRNYDQLLRQETRLDKETERNEKQADAARARWDDVRRDMDDMKRNLKILVDRK